MRLYLSAKTDIPDVVVDFIAVRLNTGEEVSLNWDESGISRCDDGFEARYNGVCFGENYANGMIDVLHGLQIVDIGFYTEAAGSFHFEIEEMEFEDDDKTLTIQNPVIPSDCPGMDVLNPIISITLTQEERKVAEAETSKLDTLTNIISSAQSQTRTSQCDEKAIPLKVGISHAYEALEQAIEMVDQYEAAGKNIHPSIGNRLMTAKLVLSEVMNDLPKDLSASTKDIEPAR